MELKKIVVSNELKAAWPLFTGCAVYADFENTERNDELWKDIDAFVAEMREKYTVDSIKLISGIEATRKAYKA